MTDKRETWTHLDDKQIAEAILAGKGIVSEAARILDCHRTSLYDHIKANPELQAVLDEAREVTLDVAENHLMKLIESDNYNAIRFYLATIGKKRGFVESTEVITKNTEDSGMDLSLLTEEELDKLNELTDKATIRRGEK